MYMSRSFQNGAFDAKGVFGTARESSTAGSYIENVKSRTLFRSVYDVNCPNVACDLNLLNKKKDDVVSDKNDSNSYSYLLNVRRGYNLDKEEINDMPAYNQMDLVSGLYSSIDLANVPTICKGVDVCVGVTGMNNNNCPPLYQYYRIDPDGELFGNAPCNINNFLNFVVLNE
jgi:hypothetical protein